MIDAQSLLNYVDRLLDNKDLASEVHSRALTSRIYYSVFYRCRDLVKQLDISLIDDLNTGSHQKLYTSMKRWANNNEKNKKMSSLVMSIALDAERLKSKRTLADYRTEYFFPPNDVIAARAKAKLIHSKIDSILFE